MLPGGRAVLGPILDMVMPATSDRGLETAPTGLCQSDGWREGHPRPDSDRDQEVPPTIGAAHVE